MNVCSKVVLLSLITINGCNQISISKLATPVIDSFDTDSQGWYVSKEAEGGYSRTGGYPGGYIYGSDSSPRAWYFVAPERFIHEVQHGYGKTLRFDLEQSATDAQFDAADIILTDSITTITFNTAYNPDTTWTAYSIDLDELAGWQKGSLKATKEDIQLVLQNLSGFRIRGEYRVGPDRGGLDNVSIR